MPYSRRPVTALRQLSPRHRDVLRLIASAYSNDQIAAELGIKAKVVNLLTNVIYARIPHGTGDNYRVGAARWYWEQIGRMTP
jgi:DNA-binding NarL/FixJ family response regulator